MDIIEWMSRKLVNFIWSFGINPLIIFFFLAGLMTIIDLDKYSKWFDLPMNEKLRLIFLIIADIILLLGIITWLIKE